MGARSSNTPSCYMLRNMGYAPAQWVNWGSCAALPHLKLPYLLKFPVSCNTCFGFIKVSFPYKECNANNRLDVLLLNELKETFCHLSQVPNPLNPFSEVSFLTCEYTKH